MTETKFIQDPLGKMTPGNGLRGDGSYLGIAKSIPSRAQEKSM